MFTAPEITLGIPQESCHDLPAWLD